MASVPSNPPATHALTARLALVVLLAWAGLALLRMTAFVEPLPPQTGEAVEPFMPFARQVVPPDATYLYVRTSFAPERGIEPRLRYEMYPRRQVAINMHRTEVEFKQVLERENIGYIVFPVAESIGLAHWSQTLTNARRVEMDEDRYILVLEPQN